MIELAFVSKKSITLWMAVGRSDSTRVSGFEGTDFQQVKPCLLIGGRLAAATPSSSVHGVDGLVYHGPRFTSRSFVNNTGTKLSTIALIYTVSSTQL